MAAKKTEKLAVRLNLRVEIDPAKWEMPKAEAIDTAKIKADLVKAGWPEAQAQIAADAAGKGTAGDGVQAVRTNVRDTMFAAVTGIEALKKAGAVIVDADKEAAKK